MSNKEIERILSEYNGRLTETQRQKYEKIIKLLDNADNLNDNDLKLIEELSNKGAITS